MSTVTSLASAPVAATHTITGNKIRYALSGFGTKVSNFADAQAAVPFTFSQEPVSRASTAEVIPNSMGLFRSDTGDCVGIHSDNFSFVQPAESLRALERARAIVGGEWKSVAVTKGGRQLAGFLEIARTVTAPRRGDKVALSLAWFDRFDGTGKARMQLLANVLACDNGMTRSESVVTFSEKHCGEITARFAKLEFNLTMSLQNQVEDMQLVISKLDNTDMSRGEVVSFAERLFPVAPTVTDVPTRTANARESIVAGFSRGTGNVGKTRWDAFNAVTEHLDWASTFRATEFSREENRFESIVSGSAATVRNRAMELLLN